TAQAILAARIDRLSPEDKRLLQAASVIGKDVPFTLLRAIAEAPEEALPRGLSHLQAAEFLYEARLFPDLEYTFKHALIHEAAYRSDAARFTPPSSPRSSASMRGVSTGISSRLPSTLCAVSSGRRRSATSSRPGPRRWAGPPTRKRRTTSSKPWMPAATFQT